VLDFSVIEEHLLFSPRQAVLSAHGEQAPDVSKAIRLGARFFKAYRSLPRGFLTGDRTLRIKDRVAPVNAMILNHAKERRLMFDPLQRADRRF